jgi:predicted PurR-regulated permease PerM
MNQLLPSLSPAGARWARLFGLTAVLALLAWITLGLRSVLTPILAALAIAYILNPLVTWFERRGCSRLLVIGTVYFFGTFALLTLGTFLVSRTIEQAVVLRENLNHYFDFAAWAPAAQPAAPASEAAASASQAAAPQAPAWEWWDELAPLLKKDGLAIANAVVASVASVVTDAINWLTLFVLLPMYSFFFLWRFNEMVRTIREHLPYSVRNDVLYVVATADRAMASFFRGRLIVCLLVGLTTGLGWTVLGVPFGLPLGALAGVLNLVPFMSVFALPLALVVTYADAVHMGANWEVPVSLAAGVYGLVQALESFVFSPLIESRASGLHPITTVIALLIGAQWAGILGMLLAIPTASTLKALAQTYLMPQIVRLAAPGAASQPESPELTTVGAAEDGPVELKAGE